MIGYRRTLEHRFDAKKCAEYVEKVGWYYKLTTAPMIYYLMDDPTKHDRWWTFCITPQVTKWHPMSTDYTLLSRLWHFID